MSKPRSVKKSFPARVREGEETELERNHSNVWGQFLPTNLERAASVSCSSPRCLIAYLSLFHPSSEVLVSIASVGCGVWIQLIPLLGWFWAKTDRMSAWRPFLDILEAYLSPAYIPRVYCTLGV